MLGSAGVKEVIELWAVIDNVTQEVRRYADGEPAIFPTREGARVFHVRDKNSGRTSSRVRRVKVTIQDD